MAQIGWTHLDILWSGPLPHHLVTGLSTHGCAVYLIRILTGQPYPIMKVDREEHHHIVLALPYNMYGTTVYLCHGLSSGVWGLVGLHLGWTQCLLTFFSSHTRFCEFSLLHVWVIHIHLVYFCFFCSCRVCGPHNQATTPTTLKCANLDVCIAFLGFLYCHTPLTIPHLMFKSWQQVAPLLVALQLNATHVGTSWD